MKTFRTYLIEGGAGIPGVSPINQENVKATLADFYKTILPKLKLKPENISPLGSTGKKAPGTTSGDIDIAVDTAALMKVTGKKTLAELYDYVADIAKKLSRDIKDSRGLGVISLGYPITNTDNKQADQTVQIDLFLVSDLKYATWIFHGPSYKDSPLKGVYRNILMAQVAKYAALKTVKSVGNEPSVRERMLFDFSKGLMKSVQSREGKKGLVKNFKTIQSELLSNDPEKITKLLFGNQYSQNDVMTTEKVLEIILSPDFKYKDKREQILRGTVETLVQQGHPVPEILTKEVNMKTFKEHVIKEDVLNEANFVGEYGELVDKRDFNSKNPEINVKGVGKFSKKILEQVIAKKLEEAAKQAKAGNFTSVDEIINAKGILSHYVKALLDVEKELTSPNIKRRLTLRKKVQDSKETQKKIMNEVSPPDPEIEEWINSNEEEYVRAHGKSQGTTELYSKAWSMFAEKCK